MPQEDQKKLGCLFSIFRLFGLSPGKPNTASQFPYRLRDDFLSPAEQSFFGVLHQVVPPPILVFPKVNVADILYVTGGADRQGFRNRINQKHVDFVLCDRARLRPIAVVELDDASHQRSDRQQRDEFLDQAFAAAGLPCIHIPAKRAYNVEELRTTLSPHLAAHPRAQVQPAFPATGPLCPKCGITMVLRTSNKRTSGENQFFGCRNFPRCREIVELT